MRTPVPILSSLRLRTAERFRAKLRPNGECLEFTGTRNKRGYGFVDVMIKGKRFPILAHRLAWVLEHQREVPADRIICHRCNNPSCCNPKHIYLGTQQDNMNDAVAARTMKGSGCLPGPNHPAARYSQEQRSVAIRLRLIGWKYSEIAREIGAYRETIKRWWIEAGGKAKGYRL